MIKKIILLASLLFLIANLAYRLDLKKTSHELVGELMYFPSGPAVRALSMGFYAPLADLVWLRFIQYYGAHRLTDARYELMYHILDILTTLDPYFAHAYTLGALMLTHDARRPDQAKNLLFKGMQATPDEWRYPFIYGFVHYVFLRDYKTAQVYFRISAQKPTAPDMPKRWAAYIALKKEKDLKTALALWTDLHNNAKNPEERSIARIYIEEIVMMMDLVFLNEKAAEFNKKTGRWPSNLNELVSIGLVDALPGEPHGERYFIKNGTVFSTWQNKRQ